MSRPTLTTLACLLLAASIVCGETSKVKLKSGAVLIGEVTEVDGKYRVVTKYGKPAIISKSDVASIVAVETLAVIYNRKRAAINANNPSDHFKLGKWAYDKQLYKIAQAELNAALKLKPTYARAKLLMRQVKAKLAERPADGSKAKGVPSGHALPSGKGIMPEWFLTDGEVSRVRLAELKANDRVRIDFRNKLLTRFTSDMDGIGDFADKSFALKFRRYTPARQAMYILANIERDNQSARDDIVVKGDPKVMHEFRRVIWPKVISLSCASASCHGGATKQNQQGGLRLFRQKGSERVDYTNFMILNDYSQVGKIIDRDHVGDSLLLQYGLHPSKAKKQHPRNIRPAFTGTNDPRYKLVRKWIESLSGPPTPKYNVQLRVPWASKPKPRPVTKQPAADLSDQDAPPAATKPAPAK